MVRCCGDVPRGYAATLRAAVARREVAEPDLETPAPGFDQIWTFLLAARPNLLYETYCTATNDTLVCDDRAGPSFPLYLHVVQVEATASSGSCEIDPWAGTNRKSR